MQITYVYFSKPLYNPLSMQRKHTKATLVHSSKTESRWHIQVSDDTSAQDKLMRVIFNDTDAHKRLRINRWGYQYKPSKEWIAFNRKFKLKKD